MRGGSEKFMIVLYLFIGETCMNYLSNNKPQAVLGDEQFR